MLTGWQNVLCTTFIAWPKCPITKHWYHHRLSFFRGCVRGSALLYTRVHQYTSISNLQSSIEHCNLTYFCTFDPTLEISPPYRISRTLIVADLGCSHQHLLFWITFCTYALFCNHRRTIASTIKPILPWRFHGCVKMKFTR